MRFKGRTVFITDAGCDSGRAIASAFIKEGANVVLNSKSDKAFVRDIIEDCKKAGTGYMVCSNDLLDAGSLNGLIEEIEQQFKRIDILIHNNNRVKRVSVEECDDATFEEIMNFNTKSAFLCTQCIGKSMMKNKYGKIVYVSSIHDDKPTGSSFIYSMSKSAVKNLCHEASVEMGKNGINMNLIEMGPVEGDNLKFRSRHTVIYDEDYKSRVPMGIARNMDNLASLVTYIASDEARYIHGSDIRIDGGFLMHYALLEDGGLR
jgi:NAD(P)-dependent dehydrogenase (short-subunit alcohol dehydrogenase family)